VVAGIVARPTGAELLPGDHAPISRIVLAWFGWKIARRSTVSPDDDVVVISLWVTGSEPIIWSTSMTELSGIGASEEPIVSCSIGFDVAPASIIMKRRRPLA